MTNQPHHPGQPHHPAQPHHPEHPHSLSSAHKPKILAADAPPITLVAGTLAGTGAAGFAEGLSATFNQPFGVASDAAGNVYVADRGNHLIRKITPGGVASLYAGNGAPGFNDGAAAAAQFNVPTGVAVDTAGNVYVADAGNHRIRKITPALIVSTFAGSGVAGFAEGPGPSARFNGPGGVAVDAAGNVFVSDSDNHRIRKISPAGLVTTLAGNGMEGYAEGPGIFAQFNNPFGIAVDTTGNVYVADFSNSRIRKITSTDGVTTLAGSGIAGFAEGAGNAARFSGPAGVAVDAAGNVYVSDRDNHRVRAITPSGTVSTLAGNGIAQFADGALAAAGFNLPCGIATGPSGNIVIADTFNYRIRTIAPPVMTVSTIAGGIAGVADAQANLAQFNLPYDITMDPTGNLLIVDAWNHRIRKLTPPGQGGSAAGVVSTVAGSGNGLLSGGYLEGALLSAKFSTPTGLVLDPAGNIYVADNGNHRIRKIAPGLVSTFVGNGTGSYAEGQGSGAMFKNPSGIAIDSAGILYVADTANHRIRKITPIPGGITGITSLLAGTGTAGHVEGSVLAAQFNTPTGVILDTNGNVYVADSQNHCIRKITPQGVVSTLAGTGVAGFADGPGATAQFNNPNKIKVDNSGNIYVADVNNNKIRKITPAGVVSTIAGSGTNGFADGKGPYAQFSWPGGLQVYPDGNTIWVTDTWNQRIRKIQ